MKKKVIKCVPVILPERNLCCTIFASRKALPKDLMNAY